MTGGAKVPSPLLISIETWSSLRSPATSSFGLTRVASPGRSGWAGRIIDLVTYRLDDLSPILQRVVDLVTVAPFAFYSSDGDTT